MCRRFLILNFHLPTIIMSMYVCVLLYINEEMDIAALTCYILITEGSEHSLLCH